MVKLDLGDRTLSPRCGGVRQQNERPVIGEVRLRQPGSLADVLAVVGGEIREMTR